MDINLNYYITKYSNIVILATKDEESFYKYLEHRNNDSTYLLDTSSNSTKIMKKKRYHLGNIKIIRSESTISRFLRSPLFDLKEKEIFLTAYAPGSYLSSLNNRADIVFKKVSSLDIARRDLVDYRGEIYIATSYSDLIHLFNAEKNIGRTFPDKGIEFLLDYQISYSSVKNFRILEGYR